MNNLEDYIINNDATLLQAMDIINSNKAKIALIVNNDGRLLGTITDGDIRRAILKRKDLQTLAKEIMNKDFFATGIDKDYKTIQKIIVERGISYVPVLDNNDKLVDLLSFNNIKEKKSSEVRVIIMAGGKGTRLKPYTDNCPKPMIKVCGKPMLELILEKCIASGFSKFYFSVNYLKEQIISYFGDGKVWDVDIKYLIEDKPLGTAGSLSLFKEFNEEPILVMNGDVLTTFDFNKMLDFHLKNNLDATLAVREEYLKFPYGVVEIDGIKLKSFQEKPILKKLVNAGVYVLSKKLFSYIKNNTFSDMPDLLSYAKLNNGSVGVFPLHEYWIDIGRPETLEKAHKEWDELNNV